MNTLLFGAEAMVVATVALLIARAFAALTGSAALRHLIRLGGFVALFLVPLFATILPSKFVLRMAPTVAPAAASAASPHIIGWIVIGLVVLWAAGTIAFLARGFAGALALRTLHRRSRPHGFDAGRLAQWAARAGLGDHWTLYLSADTETPLSWGIFHPIVMLPEQCADWAADQLDAAMLHELAHLRRRDGFAQAVALLGCALYWLNPLVWVEAKALRADAEIAADDMVILSGVKPSTYAELLLRVADGAMQRFSFARLELAMAERSGIEMRIQSVLSSNQSRSGVTKMQILKTISLGIGAALLVALARPSFGADAPPVSPTVLVQSTATAAPSAPAVNVLPPVAQSIAPLSSRRHRSTGAVASRPAIAANGVDASVAATVARELADAHLDETVAKAVADAHVAEAVTKSLADMHLDETIARAVADAHVGETVTKALADAHLDEKINAALKKAQPQIDAAIAQQQRLLQQMQQPAVPPSP